MSQSSKETEVRLSHALPAIVSPQPPIAKLILLAFWSDEWREFDYRGVKLRVLKLRILNDTEIRTYVVGIYPEGATAQSHSSLQLCRSSTAGTIQDGCHT